MSVALPVYLSPAPSHHQHQHLSNSPWNSTPHAPTDSACPLLPCRPSRSCLKPCASSLSPASSITKPRKNVHTPRTLEPTICTNPPPLPLQKKRETTVLSFAPTEQRATNSPNTEFPRLATLQLSCSILDLHGPFALRVWLFASHGVRCGRVARGRVSGVAAGGCPPPRLPLPRTATPLPRQRPCPSALS